jgi:hypothetical protein
MIFTLEALPAYEGDCLILHWGKSKDDFRLAVIDGGPRDTFTTHLRKRLVKLAGKPPKKPLEIEMAMVSHVDNDHVTGINALFSEIRGEVDANIPKSQRTFRVLRLWHNTFDDIVGNRADALYKTLASAIPADVNGELNPDLVSKLDAELQARDAGLGAADRAHAARAIAEVFAGQGEGRDLRDVYEVLRDSGWVRFPLNAPFERNSKPTLLSIRDATPLHEAISGVEFDIYGPMQEEIDALQQAFDEYIQKNGLNVQAVLAAYADKSIPNLSSVVCVASAKVNGTKRTMLLTGDARGDKVIAGLRKGGLLVGETLKVDLLKVPHHGSDRNVTKGFFETIIADHYVFSADGLHGNPDLPTLKWLVEARGKEARYTMYFTYPLEEIDALRKKEAAKHGKAWSKPKDSIEAFIAKCEAAGHAFKWKAGGPLKINLGDTTVTW